LTDSVHTIGTRHGHSDHVPRRANDWPAAHATNYVSANQQSSLRRLYAKSGNRPGCEPNRIIRPVVRKASHQDIIQEINIQSLSGTQGAAAEIDTYREQHSDVADVITSTDLD
jgi:hypothetical protein